MFINVAAEAVEGDTRTDYQNPLDIIRVRAGGGGALTYCGIRHDDHDVGVGGEEIDKRGKLRISVKIINEK